MIIDYHIIYEIANFEDRITLTYVFTLSNNNKNEHNVGAHYRITELLPPSIQLHIAILHSKKCLHKYQYYFIRFILICD